MNHMIDFLRVQKTGGTTFGEHIMPKFCGTHCAAQYHLTWSQMGKTGNAFDVTLLRDPVERTLSEFLYMRTQEGKIMTRQGQWQFKNSTWLGMVQNTPDVDDALNVYLHGYPFSPSRNRQTLYMLGFSDWSGAQKSNPGAMYDWRHDHNRLLAQAQHHLSSMTAFGITDCYLTSMRVIAQALGWNAQAVVEFASNVRARSQDPQLKVLPSHRFANATSSTTFANATPSAALKGKWRRLFDPSIVKTIEQQNAVDMDLYKFALALFKGRFGEDCVAS